MDITVTNSDPAAAKTACLVLPIGNQRKLTGCAERVDNACDGRIGQLLRQGDLSDKPGSTLIAHQLPGLGAKRVALISTGKGPITPEELDLIAAAQARTLTSLNIKRRHQLPAGGGRHRP